MEPIQIRTPPFAESLFFTKKRLSLLSCCWVMCWDYFLQKINFARRISDTNESAHWYAVTAMGGQTPRQSNNLWICNRVLKTNFVLPSLNVVSQNHWFVLLAYCAIEKEKCCFAYRERKSQKKNVKRKIVNACLTNMAKMSNIKISKHDKHVSMNRTMNQRMDELMTPTMNH